MELKIPYKDKKIEGAIAFFTSKHKEATKENLSQTALYKYLAFFDFRSLEESGQPALGLTYVAMQYGPVPREIYIEKKYRESEYYKFTEDKDTKSVTIIPTSKKSDYLDYLSKYDIELMGNLIEIFAKNWITARIMSDASHDRGGGIKAWRKTWKKNPNSIIDMADTFDNFNHKSYENGNMTAAEEHFYIYQKLHGI